MARFIQLPPPAHALMEGDPRRTAKYINADLVIRVEASGITGECRVWFVGQDVGIMYLANVVYLDAEELVARLNSP